MAFVAAIPEVAGVAAEAGPEVAEEALPEIESVGKTAFHAAREAFHEVEPVLRTLTVPIHRPPPPEPPASAMVLGGGCGCNDRGGRVPFGVIVALALIITLTILIIALLVRRSRGCSWKMYGRDGFSACCAGGSA